MEVHSHTHTPHKKFTHYLWEFLMLFLAVFCGFLAENIREHKVERIRENEYMQSMAEDIRQDIRTLNDGIEKTYLMIRGKDTMVQLISKGITRADANQFYDLHW